MSHKEYGMWWTVTDDPVWLHREVPDDLLVLRLR